jgi:NAD+ synthase (glutamine-hydrolysing)
MRIALAQFNSIIGDFENTTSKIIQRIHDAEGQGADLIVFPELAVCGYPPEDYLEYPDFIHKCKQSVETIALECKNITAIIGLPTTNPDPEGKNLYNSAAILHAGKISGYIHKSLLPTYDIFDEYRYFEPNRTFKCIEINGVKIALTICEDLWNAEDDPMYVSSPMEQLIKEHPSLMINIAASPFDYTHAEERKAILKRNADKYQLPLIYVNHAGAQTELIFDGGSLAMNKNGELISELTYFKEENLIIEFRQGDLHTPKSIFQKPTDRIALIHDALVLGIKDYFSKQGFKKAILGLSGGIDSAVVICLAAEALGSENVKALLMPSSFSSKGSVDDSLQLASILGVQHETIAIQPLYESFLSSLSPAFKGMPFNLTEENLQARIRGTLLMAQSNKFGAILLNTSNKSELAVGYGTLYGDMCGGLSVIGDVYKTDVYRLASWINREKEIIPNAIITKAPSAELRPDQKDADSLPEYDQLDPLLYQFIEKRKSIAELIDAGFEAAMVKRIVRLVNANEFKRHQAPPILRISPKAFGSGRRIPIVAGYLSR